VDTNLAITAAVTLIGVALGGWLTVWNQDRMWRRQDSSQWRDIRLSAYEEFLSAYRAYLAFVQDPNSKIAAIAHPRRTGEFMPFFDADGRPYKENLEAARMKVSLVSQKQETTNAMMLLMQRVRAIAATRATQLPGEIPDASYQSLFAAHNTFVSAARREVGLAGSLQDDYGVFMGT
jgi:hypothetical protein